MRKPKHLTQQQTNELLSYVQQVKRLLLLGDAQILLTMDPADVDEETNGVWASINWTDQKDIGLLSVCTGWAKLPDAVKTECIVHEMIHLLLRDVDDKVNHLQADADMGTRASARWRVTYNEHMERAVHKLTMLLMPTVPAWPGDNPDAYVRRSDVFVQRTDEEG